MEVGAVKLYTFVVTIGGQRFEGHIPALTFEQVKEFVPTAEDIGELIETRPVGQICSICAGDMVITPKVVESDDWPEEL